MQIIFMGTPDFAVPTLDALVAAGHDILAVYSQRPRPAGRGKALRPGAVHARAEALGIPVRCPLSLRDPAAQADFAALNADVGVVAAYGLILPQAVLDAPRLGCLNVHGSLLPRWRGAAPVQRAILAGDAETGVGIMQMERGLDTGPVRLEGRTPVGDKDAGTLTAELAALGAALMVRVLADPDRFPPVPQVGEANYAPKIDKAETRLDFAEPADAVVRRIRAFAPAPGAWFEEKGDRIRILSAIAVDGHGAPGTVLDDALAIACGTHAIRPVLVQRAGRGAMTPADLLRGFPIPAGTTLG